jgi:hypothetical protein
VSITQTTALAIMLSGVLDSLNVRQIQVAHQSQREAWEQAMFFVIIKEQFLRRGRIMRLYMQTPAAHRPIVEVGFS